MTFSESGFSPKSPDNPYRTECLRECASELGALKAEICEQAYLPPTVLQYLTTNAPEGQQDAAIAHAKAMLTVNPNVFDVPETILPMILGTILTKLDIEKSHNVIDGLRDEIKLEELSRTDPHLKDLKGRTLLRALSAHDLVQAKPNLRAYLGRIDHQLETISGLAATPEEAAALDVILNTSALYIGSGNMPDVFADVLARADSSQALSDSTKAKLHQLFKIPTIKTAGDIQSVLDKGYGLDATGAKIPITQDRKARVFPNTYLYELPTGERIFEVNLTGDRNLKIRFDGETTENTLFDLVYTAQIIFEMEKLNLAKPIWQRGWNISHGGEIDLHYDDIITAKRVGDLFLGGMSGHNARLLGEGHQDRLAHDFQALPKKGDAAEGDNDAVQALADYKKLGIVNDDGAMNWAQFEKAVHYIQDVSAKGGKPDFEDLKAHLSVSETLITTSA